MTSQAASFSGVLTTTSQLAITIGIAAVGALYLTAGRLSALPPCPSCCSPSHPPRRSPEWACRRRMPSSSGAERAPKPQRIAPEFKVTEHDAPCR